jgi:type IV pilus assembly protein PilO
MPDFKKMMDQFRGLNPRDVGTWPVIPRVTAALAIVLVVLLAGYFFQWSDQLDQLQQLQANENKLKEDYKNKLAQAVNLDILKKEKDQVSTYVFRLEKQLPSKAEMDALLSDINQAGVGRGLQFELFKPGSASVKNYYAELPIDIRITGNYHDLGQFTSDIASLPRIVTLNNLAITMPPQGATTPLTMEAVAKTFRYLDPDEVQAQKKTAPKPGAPK